MIEEIFKKGGWQRITLYALSALFVALLIFQAGMFTGERRAAFTYGTGAAYYRVFDENHGPGSRDFLMEAHGAAGKIVSLNLPTFVVSGPDQTEKVVMVGDDTEIRRFHSEASSSDLGVDDFVVVIGEPNSDAQIDAKLIRILPPPPER